MNPRHTVTITDSPRCTKDLIEESLFDRGRDLFSEVGLVFFDTTSIYFEEAGGELHRHDRTTADGRA